MVPHNDLAQEQLLDRLSNLLDLWSAVEVVGSQPRLRRPIVRHGLSVSDDVMGMEPEMKIKDERWANERIDQHLPLAVRNTDSAEALTD